MRGVLRITRYSLSLLLLAGALHAGAAIPNADNPKCQTHRDFDRGKREFLQRMLVESYKTVSKRDPRWDAATIKFLDAFCYQFAYDEIDPLFRDTEPPGDDKMMELARAAESAGCDDPLFDMVRALFSNSKAQARPIFRKALPGLVEQKYPPYVLALAARQIIPVLDPQRDGAEIGKYGQMNWDQSKESLSIKSQPADLRYLLQSVQAVFQSAPLANKAEFCTAIEQSKDTDPWLINMLRGQYEIRAAWEARGAGTEETVSNQGWADFKTHLSKARDYLVKAQALHPDFPEAATDMITVAMGAGGDLKEKTRDWFDKAAKAQIDYAPAYGTYLYSIYPRWGGSYPQMIQFAQECVDTGRFDTAVPMQVIQVAKDIDSDTTQNMSAFTIPPLQAAIRQFLNQAAEKSSSNYARDYFAAYHVALSWRLHQYEDAAQALKKGDNTLLPETFRRVGGWAPFAVSQIHLMNTPAAQTVRQADKDAAAGDLAAAILAFNNLSSKLPKNDPGQLYLKHRAKSLEYQKSFDAGDWVTITPTADFAPWSPVTGDFKVDATGAIIVTADKTGDALLLCRTRFNSGYELKFKLDSPDLTKPAAPTVFLEANESQRTSVGVETVQSKLFFKSAGRTETRDLKLTDADELHLSLPLAQPGQWPAMTIDFNQKRLLNGIPLLNTVTATNAFVGIGIEGTIPGAVARFREIQIRRLKTADGN